MKTENTFSIRIARILGTQLGFKIKELNLTNWNPFDEKTVGFSIVKKEFTGAVSIGNLEDDTFLVCHQEFRTTQIVVVRIRERDLGAYVESISAVKIPERAPQEDTVPRAAMQMSAN